MKKTHILLILELSKVLRFPTSSQTTNVEHEQTVKFYDHFIK